MGKVERVARAICEAAGRSISKAQCVMCENGECAMWKLFREEARTAVRAMKDRDDG